MTQPIALMTSAADSGGTTAPSPSGDTSRPQMEKAALKLYDPTPSTGGSAPGAERGSISFQFNPKEVTIQKTAKWERKTAKGAKKAGPPEFSGSEPCKLTLELFFDASGKHDGSVVAAVESLFGCCVPTDDSVGKKKPSPPLVVLHWGAITSFPAFITSVSAKYTLFSARAFPSGRSAASRWRRCRTSHGGRTRRPAVRRSGTHTRWSTATRWPRSPSRSTATRRCGVPSRRTTASTTRSGSVPAPCSSLPAPEELTQVP